MDIALVTTTVNVPEVLRRYRADDPDVHFVIAGDTKSPHDEIRALAREIGNTVYLSPAEQAESWPALSSEIGWRSVQRRNLAVLEAARLGADVIVTIDDDNAPSGESYFSEIAEAFESRQQGFDLAAPPSTVNSRAPL